MPTGYRYRLKIPAVREKGAPTTGPQTANPLDIVPFRCQIGIMTEQAFYIDRLPSRLRDPLLVAGFDGWGNALDVSRAMAAYLIRKLEARPFARINPDLFYRYDKARPMVNIENGILEKVTPPGGTFFSAETRPHGRGIVILAAGEPHLRWTRFADRLLSLCEDLGVKTVITLGSMYDNVLHSDRIISGIASSNDLLSRLREKNVIPVNYNGESAIHSTLLSEAQRRGIDCISLWGHCPYYLEGTTHFGLLSALGDLLSSIGDFELDISGIEDRWRELNTQIRQLIDKTPEFQKIIRKVRKAKVRGSWENIKDSLKKGDKVIPLKDFLDPD